MESSEQESIRRVLAGDREEYRVLMERHLPAVLTMTLRMTGNPHDAEEVAQEAFLQAYRKLSTFREDASFGTWVYRIAMNTALNHIKRRTRKPEWNAESIDDAGGMTPVSHQPTPEAAAMDEQARQRREQAMETLSPMERTAFVLRHIEDQPMDEVAKVLGVNSNSARQTLFRAVSKLRRELAPARQDERPAYPAFLKEAR